ncbi:phosphoenolpyruvate carboxykinase (ATP) [Paucilactobacillus nenjiangensis]|uniref:phosphoenolpyruvate carboxykinase (ATP) n=1 Tax=Paucilactobacillus nenjiangensis TaxID=1296540 RepID=UPI0010F8DA2B|nr:phosphoenolpyruvate carboxykinase (ATP) [Paucilactobacillus nenjiangensis]
MENVNSIKTGSTYLNLDRKIAVLKYNRKYLSNIFSLLNSDEMLQVVDCFLSSTPNHQTKINKLTSAEYVAVIKRLLIDDATVYDAFDAKEILTSVENLYSFYRSFLRISVMNATHNQILNTEFLGIDDKFNDLVRNLYRAVEEKIQGFPNHTYRQVNAGTNASIMIKPYKWSIPTEYEQLKSINFIDKIMLRPPMMMHTPSNKRKGTFSSVDYNPIDHFDGKPGEWYCYPAKIGESLAFIYFNQDYFVSGLALANLFELADEELITNHKPDLILLFGVDKTEGDVSHYHYDESNDIWVGEVPYNDQTTYFGYMKKMCLTLHNLHMIYQNRLPIHGSMVKIKFSNGKTKTVVFFGDSGAGKSESIEALQEIAGEQIHEMETIFDDMGSFTLDPNDPEGLYAQGTEIGAFVRLDDLSSAVAFNNMDRGVYLNPEQKNARVIIPANTYDRVIKRHHIDMWVYANNYDTEIGLHRFEKLGDAKKTFTDGKRFALGTTDEVGMSTTFFANPFGPVQEQARTQTIIDGVFDVLFKNNVYVGEIYTHLGNDKSKDSLNQSVQQMLDTLMDS